MNNLPNLYNEQGKYESAVTTYEACVCFCENKIGRDHPDTLTTIKNLAKTYAINGKFDSAELLLVRCLNLSLIHI